MNFLIFSGSARKGNYTQHVADLVHQLVTEAGHQSEIISPKSLGLSFEDEGTGADYPELTKKVKAADGYILVAPEYNHGYPGSLKFMLDLNLKEYIHKPVSFVGVSAGPWGGTRVIESLLNPVREMGMVATFTDANVTDVQNEVIDGEFTDPDKWKKRISRMLDELEWMATTLKKGRESEK